MKDVKSNTNRQITLNQGAKTINKTKQNKNKRKNQKAGLFHKRSFLGVKYIYLSNGKNKTLKM